MIGLLIITHETIGGTYQGLIHHFFPSGFPEDIRTPGVQLSEDQNDIIDNVIAALQEFPDSHDVLIMTDIFDATPCSAARRLVHENRSAIPADLNAPMMIKATQYSSQAENLSDFTGTVKEAAIRGIFTITSAPEDPVCKGNG